MSARVYDVVMFGGELDMLEFRLNHLAEKVYRTVICEADVTHRGYLKPLTFLENHRRFAEFADRIVYVPVRGLPSGTGDHWGREHAQRDAAMRVLGDAGPDAVLLVADVDEIPSDAALQACPERGAAVLRQKVTHSAVDWLYPQPQLTSVIVRAGLLGSPGAESLSRIRDARYGLPVIEDGGWHFAWLGTDADRRAKLERGTCHLEMPQAEWNAIAAGATRSRGEHHAPDSQVIAAEVDESWPQWIRDRKCPPSWFRPRGCSACAAGNHAACEGGDGLRGTGCECYTGRLDEAHDWTAEFAGGEL